MRTFALSMLCAAAALTLLQPEPALAWCQSCSVERAGPGCGQPCECNASAGELLLAWQRPCIEYALHDSGSRDIPRSQIESVFDRSFARWTDVSCPGGGTTGFEVRRATENSLCTTPEFATDGGNSNTIAFVGDWASRMHLPSAFALTTTWFSTRTGEIIDADMELNQEDWDWGVCESEDCTSTGVVDLENTAVHELGHFFGLAHTGMGTGTGDDESTMWACADAGETLKRTLAPDDIEGICAIYPPGSLGEVCEFAPIGGFDPTCKAVRPDEGCSCSISAGAPSRGFALSAFLLAALCYRRRSQR